MDCKIQYYEQSNRAWCGAHNQDEATCLRAENAKLRAELLVRETQFKITEKELSGALPQNDELIKERENLKDILILEGRKLDDANRLINEVMEKTKCNCSPPPIGSHEHRPFCPHQMACIRNLHESQKRKQEIPMEPCPACKTPKHPHLLCACGRG